MLFFLAFAASTAAHSPEIEAILRHRDEKRQAEAQQKRFAQDLTNAALATVIPPAQAKRLSACLASADAKPEAGIIDADQWLKDNGGAYAAQCRGYALGLAGRWAEASGAFEAGAALTGLDGPTRGRLLAQAGNAALAGGDAPRALRNLDQALAQRLPPMLSTGEIYLDRARARVAASDNVGARSDLDQAVRLASGDPLAWLLSATLARRMDDLALARVHIEEAARLARDDANVALEQGVIYALSGDRDAAARAAFERAQGLTRAPELIAKAKAYLAQLPPAQRPAETPPVVAPK